MNAYEWITTALVPITNIVTWFAARRKRRNDAITQMQATIDMLVLKNNELVEEVTKLRIENVELKSKICDMESTINNLKK